MWISGFLPRVLPCAPRTGTGLFELWNFLIVIELVWYSRNPVKTRPRGTSGTRGRSGCLDGLIHSSAAVYATGRSLSGSVRTSVTRLERIGCMATGKVKWFNDK